VIRREHLEKLLGSAERNPVLVVSGGRAEVVSADAADSGEHAGAVPIASRDALVEELGASLNEEQLDQLAERLDAAFRNMGG
jgi:hypothetical protein